MATTKTKPVLYPLTHLRNLTSIDLAKLGENVHIAEFGLDFYALEGDIQATLYYDGEYTVYYYSIPKRAYEQVDVPGIPFGLAKQLIGMGFAVDLCEDEYIARID